MEIPQPLAAILKNRWPDLILVICSLTTMAVSLSIYVGYTGQDAAVISADGRNYSSCSFSPQIVVEVNGAVLTPGVYELQAGMRLNDAIKKAGGLTDTADRDYFSRNFNLARYASDQEKIYVPSLSETVSGIVGEEKQYFSYRDPVAVDTESIDTAVTGTSLAKVDINTASSEELDTLPGVGPATAGKIITNRPYSTLEELIQKKSVKQNVFDQIRGQLTLSQ